MTAAVVALSNTLAISLGQGPFGHETAGELDFHDVGGVGQDGAGALRAGDRAGTSAWTRVMMGLDEAFREYRRETQPKPPADNDPENDEDLQPPEPEPPVESQETSWRSLETNPAGLIDAAIDGWPDRGYPPAVVPAQDCGDPRAQSGARLEPDVLALLAQCFSHACLLWAACRPARRFDRPRGIPLSPAKHRKRVFDIAPPR
jgi:hypothetical protein